MAVLSDGGNFGGVDCRTVRAVGERPGPRAPDNRLGRRVSRKCVQVTLHLSSRVFLAHGKQTPNRGGVLDRLFCRRVRMSVFRRKPLARGTLRHYGSIGAPGKTPGRSNCGQTFDHPGRPTADSTGSRVPLPLSVHAAREKNAGRRARRTNAGLAKAPLAAT